MQRVKNSHFFGVCSYSSANNSKGLGVQTNEHTNIFSVYLGINLEICTFTQQKCGT